MLIARLLFGMSCILAVPALAQNNGSNDYGGGTRLQPRAAQIVQSGPYAAQLVLQQFAMCLVTRRMGSTEQALALPLDTPGYDKGIQRLFASVGDACLEGSGDLQFPASLLRGSLFEALYRRKFGPSGVDNFPGNFETGYAASFATPLSPEVRQHITLQQFSECVIKSDAANVRRLVLSSPGSSSEEASIVTLSSGFSSCFPAGTSLKMTKPSLRAMMAEALYRMNVLIGAQEGAQ